MSDNATLSGELLNWAGELLGGPIVEARRHDARREAWVLDAETSAGRQRGFLRLDRALAEGRGSRRNLRRETSLIRALAHTDVPAQRILGWNSRHCAALQSWLPGEANLSQAPSEHRRRIMREFMEVLARLHRVDIDELDVADFQRPTSAREQAMLELEAIEEPALFPVSACRSDALCAFGKHWLERHAPTGAAVNVLVQGDTGPGNFMFDQHGITGIMDWEWAHFGDPMEDLGNIWLRDFLNPASDGDLRPLFDHYSRCSGFSLDHSRILYYRIHQLVRSAITLHYLHRELDWRTAIPLNLGYRAIIELETCAAMAEQAGRPRRTVPTLAPPPLTRSVQRSLARQLEGLIAPHLEDPFSRQLALGQSAVLDYLALQAHHQADLTMQELEGLRRLLGERITEVESGRAELLAQLPALSDTDELRVLDHLYEQALNQAALMAPLTQPWQEARWARVESPPTPPPEEPDY